MDTLLKLCTKKKKIRESKAGSNRLKQQLAEVCTAQESSVTDCQITKDAVAAKDIVEREVRGWDPKLVRLKNAQNQVVLARTAEVADLNVQLCRAMKRATDGGFERNEPKAHMRKFLSSQ